MLTLGDKSEVDSNKVMTLLNNTSTFEYLEQFTILSPLNVTNLGFYYGLGTLKLISPPPQIGRAHV